jgi:hypothetical protein
MPTPVFAVGAGDTLERETISRNVAASRLGLSIAGVDKLIRSSILTPDIAAETVDELAARPWLQVLEGELTVLRTDARQPAYPGEDRKWIGFDAGHNDDELKATSLRWWRSSPVRILDNELFAVTVSTIPVAVYQITGHAGTLTREDEDTPRHKYSGKLLARVYPGMPRPRVLGTMPGHLRTAVEQIMSSRIKVSSGGPIGYLEPR